MAPLAILITMDRSVQEAIKEMLPPGRRLVITETIENGRREVLLNKGVPLLVIDDRLLERSADIKAEISKDFQILDAESIVIYVNEEDLCEVRRRMNAA